MTIEQTIQEDRFQATILALRAENFRKGIPFLILSETLPDGMGYKEFSDGHIEQHEVYTEGAAIKSRVIRTLTDMEATKIRIENGLF